MSTVEKKNSLEEIVAAMSRPGSSVKHDWKKSRTLTSADRTSINKSIGPKMEYNKSIMNATKIEARYDRFREGPTQTGNHKDEER